MGTGAGPERPPVGHNHFTRDIKRYGLCPACDKYWDRWNDGYMEDEVVEP